jgi:hypothetical protein
MSKTPEGYLLIADITGYTRYLSESELEHAQETLTALLELLVENTRPPLVISRLAGYAVISYGLREDFFQGQTLIEKIEDTCVTFRKAIERLVLNNGCLSARPYLGAIRSPYRHAARAGMGLPDPAKIPQYLDRLRQDGDREPFEWPHSAWQRLSVLPWGQVSASDHLGVATL